MAAASQAFQLDVIKHELVHYMSAKIVTTQPLWFSEGVATTTRPSSTTRTRGASPSAGRRTSCVRRAQEVGVSSIESMFAAKTIDRDDAAALLRGRMDHRPLL